MSSFIPKAQPFPALPGAKKVFANVKPVIDTKMPAKFLRPVQKPSPVLPAAIKQPAWNSSAVIVRKDDIKLLPGNKQTVESLRKPFRARPAPNFKAIHADLPRLKAALPAKKKTVEPLESEKKPFRARPAPDFKAIHALLPPAKPTRSRIPVRLQSAVSAPSIQETKTSDLTSKIPIRIGSGLRK